MTAKKTTATKTAKTEKVANAGEVATAKTASAEHISGVAGDVSTTTEPAVEEAQAPANIEPAVAIDTSGSPQQIVPDVDMNHPAVDNDPRAATTVAQNRIDFNDPTISGAEAVERNLEKQR